MPTAKTSPPPTTTATSTTFAWGPSLACVATYRVLEDDDKMDQFEDKDVAFDDAGNLKMGSLRFWPGASLPPGALDNVGRLKAQEFAGLVAKHYSANKQDSGLTAMSTIRELGKVFAKKTGTLTDLAAIVAKRATLPGPA